MTQQLLKQLAGGGLSQISQQIGADKKTTSSALSAVMPTLVSALAKDHDGSIFDDILGMAGKLFGKR